MRTLSCILVLTALAQAQDAPKSRAEVEQIVHEYLMKHPEVILEAVNKYQENQRADEKKKVQQSLSANHEQLVADPASPTAGATTPDAVVVVEFFDYRCGYCKRMAPTVAKLVTGSNIRLVYKELPILGPDSIVAAKAALAARKQGDYSKFHQDLMTLEGPITLAAIEKLAARNKLDFAKLKDEMEAPDIKAQIDATQKLAKAIGIDATPSFVIGSDLYPGAMDEQELQANIAKVQRR